MKLFGFGLVLALTAAVRGDDLVFMASNDPYEIVNQQQQQQQIDDSTSLSVFERQLVVEKPLAKDILDNHATIDKAAAHQRLFESGPTLAFVTPWNNHGYDVVKMFLGKFTHVAPLWFRIKRNQESAFILEGAHDVDKGWMAEVRAPAPDGRRALITPLFQVSEFTQGDYMALIQDPRAASQLASLLFDEVERHGFDGIVLEMTAIPASLLVVPIKLLHQRLSSVGKQLIWVVPPQHEYVSVDRFGYREFTLLEPFVNLFSVMTYDFTLPNSAGPVSPLQWIRDNIERICPSDEDCDRSKILLGLNIILEQHDPDLQWDQNSAEHVFVYQDSNKHKHTVYYPTLYSLDQRISLAEELGTGLSIWEVGQGLDYFYDLL
eukprot:jgi/Hompol1/5903/HPOL_000339-RA